MCCFNNREYLLPYLTGESNAAVRRQPYLSMDTVAAAAATYSSLYGNEDGTVPATFQVIHLLGWKPASSQAKAARRGTYCTSHFGFRPSKPQWGGGFTPVDLYCIILTCLYGGFGYVDASLQGVQQHR
jgi:hypothetical protein